MSEIASMPPARDPLAEASQWFARRRSGELSEAEAAELGAWLAADDANRLAYRDLQIAWRDVETMRDDPAIMAMRAEASAVSAPRRRLMVGAVAASLLAGVVTVGSVGGPALIWRTHRYADREYRTTIGEQTRIKLADGTVVTLNTDSRLRTVQSGERRLVYLDRGQAFFKVAKDRRHPFVVTAGGRTVTALGTAFDVRVDDGRSFKVTLVEGRVRVEGLPAPVRATAGAKPKAPGAAPAVLATEMVAGTQLVAADDTRWSMQRADVARETSWTSGQLIFYSAPLTQVVAELNRYSDKKIVMPEAAWAARPISGAFKAGDIETFARGLQTYRLATIQSDTATQIVLGPPE